MKTPEEILKILDTKAAEHDKIVRQLASDIQVLREKLAEMIQNKAAKDALVTQSQAMMVLKDKLVFHKACLLQIRDIEADIKNV